ncbi:muconate/chloromuconate family cycloisomerase [Robbsia andropogonis]|uniref:muconate/chloromuconate family cycloisomerase n=1 Tax=Robbsia andropogonis TaxID=28092 RepID=UPI000466CB46|nr:muconate/chloromuconate family cycloisomerase [Robbsia andropogonis]
MIPSTATIDSVETLLLDVPTIRPHRLSVAVMRGQTLVIVRIRLSDGTIGLGEATTIGGLSYGEESPESIKVNIDTYLAPLLVGKEMGSVLKLMAPVRKSAQGNRFAKCALETALFDATAKRLNVPLSMLFGGAQHDALAVAWTLASGDTSRDIAEAEQMLEARRHCVFKLKIGARSVVDDVRHCAEIQRALGGGARIRVDLNQAWTETQAVSGIAMLADAGVELVEQPISASNRRGLKRLTDLARVPIMADEALHGTADAFALAVDHAADVFALKIAQSGGLLEAAHVAAIARAGNIDLYGGTMLEGPIGTIATAHLCATFDSLAWGSELFGPLLLTEEILTEPLVYKDFALHLPQGPGLGIVLDDEKVARFRRDGSRSST